MSSAIKKVVVIGPSGKLGPSTIKHLLDVGIQVDCLTRDPAQAAGILPPELDSQINLKQTNYKDKQTLVSLLKGYDAGIILLPNSVINLQITIIDALIEARVPHIIPSAFSIDLSSDWAQCAPCYEGKRKVEDYIAQKASEGLVTYNAIQTGIFLEFAVEMGLFVKYNPVTEPTILWDDGEAVLSVSRFDDVGKAIAMALKRKDEIPPNSNLFVQSAAVSQNRLLRLASELIPRRRWDVVPVDTADIERVSWEAFRRGDVSDQTMHGFIAAGSFGRGLGLHKHLDNDVLGIEQLDDEGIKAVLAEYI